MRGAKDLAKAAIPKVNRVAERFGVRLQPVHYYSEVPDRRWLAENRHLWAKPAPLVGIDWDLDAQLEWLARITADHLQEGATVLEYQARLPRYGPGFGSIESQVLYCFIRNRKPPRVVEIGSGMSTAIIAQARDRNIDEGGERTDITCVEPYPSDHLRRLDVDVIAEKAQAVPLDVLAVGPGDLLFIDSTHAVRTGSEVVRLYLEVLPSLPPGVSIHVHDIFLPYLFSPFVLDDVFDWQETTLLAALLTNNPRMKIRCCMSALCHDRGRDMQRVLPLFRPEIFDSGLGTRTPGRHFPASIWLETSDSETTA